MKASAAAAHPPTVDGSGVRVESDTRNIPRLPLKPGLPSPATMNTLPLAAPLIVKKMASMLLNTVIVPVAVPPALPVIVAWRTCPAPLLKNNPTTKP